MAKVQWAIFINYLPEIILKQFTEESHKHYAKTSSAIHEKTPPNGESIAPAPNAQRIVPKVNGVDWLNVASRAERNHFFWAFAGAV